MTDQELKEMHNTLSKIFKSSSQNYLLRRGGWDDIQTSALITAQSATALLALEKEMRDREERKPLQKTPLR